MIAIDFIFVTKNSKGLVTFACGLNFFSYATAPSGIHRYDPRKYEKAAAFETLFHFILTNLKTA